MTYSTNYFSPLGEILLTSDGKSLTGLWFVGQKYFAATAGDLTVADDLVIFDKTKKWLGEYFAGGRPAISDLPIAPTGSEFRRHVWRALCEIPYGSVMTYGDIAKKLGCKSAQAIGGAVGHNPISIIIPCHRVMGAGGDLTGYAGGLDKKISLLNHEQK